jgi:hypothetical protein
MKNYEKLDSLKIYIFEYFLEIHCQYWVDVINLQNLV